MVAWSCCSHTIIPPANIDSKTGWKNAKLTPRLRMAHEELASGCIGLLAAHLTASAAVPSTDFQTVTMFCSQCSSSITRHDRRQPRGLQKCMLRLDRHRLFSVPNMDRAVNLAYSYTCSLLAGQRKIITRGPPPVFRAGRSVEH